MSELVIDRLGHRGDGVAETPDGARIVPFALPGERVRPGEAGAMPEILSPSPARVAPACPHFGRCGGCQLQHLAPAAALDWKRGIVAASLEKRGLDPAMVAPGLAIPPRTRRRVTLTAVRRGRDVVVGFFARGTHHVTSAGPCPVLTPALEAMLPALPDFAAPGLGNKSIVKLHLIDSETGVDLAIAGARPLARKTEGPLIARAGDLGLARLTWNGEPLAQFRQPRIAMGPAYVVPPPAGFLQPSREGQDALTEIVRAATAGARYVGDLYCGCGTLSLPLATASPVHAVEADAASLNALREALKPANHRPGAAPLHPVTTERRDLDRRPLMPDDLKRYDALVFDPPRAGAEAQALQLAGSTVRRIVAVSCNPATFSRDARHLVDGGYVLSRVVPVDQFAWSSHIELVATFEKD